MKSLHFCTKRLIRQIKYEKNDKYHFIKTYRTGYIPTFLPGEIIKLNERRNKKDSFLKQGIVIAIIPIQYRDIGIYGKMEILDTYKKRKFKPLYWFFEIIIKKWSINHFKEFNYDGIKLGVET